MADLMPLPPTRRKRMTGPGKPRTRKKGPSAQAYLRANDNASFKRTAKAAPRTGEIAKDPVFTTMPVGEVRPLGQKVSAAVRDLKSAGPRQKMATPGGSRLPKPPAPKGRKMSRRG